MKAYLPVPAGERIEAAVNRERLLDRNLDDIAAPPCPDRAWGERDLNSRRQPDIGRMDDIEREKLRAPERVGTRGAGPKDRLAFDGFVATVEARDHAALHAIIRRARRRGG